MPLLRTTPWALLVALGALAALPSAASAAVTCTFDPASHALTIANPGGGFPQVYADSTGKIVVTNSTVGYADCGSPAPTVTTTDTISYATTQANAYAYFAGGMGPGFTDEGDGSSEIEIDVSGVDRLRSGSNTADTVAGSSAGAARFNFNAGESAPDVDMVAAGLEDLEYDGPRFDGRGSSLTGDALAIELFGRGTPGADTYYGGAARTTVWGDAGDDVLTAGTGPAALDGETGNDTLTGGPAADRLNPGPGNDAVDGGGGDSGDTFVCGYRVISLPTQYQYCPATTLDLARATPQNTGDGTDTIAAIEAVDIHLQQLRDDTIRGTTGANAISTGGGDDVIMGRGGNDRLDGGGGSDTADYSEAPDAVDVDLTRAAPQATGGDGSDTLIGVESATGSSKADALVGTDGVNTLDGGGGADTITSAGGDDILKGGDGGDVMSGGDGWDTLIPGSSPSGGVDGVDEIDGGNGLNTLSYEDRTVPVAVKLDGVRNEGADPNGDGVSSASEEGDRATGIYRATGGTGNDRFRAFGQTANVFRGGPGDDRLDGGLGRDNLYGGKGIDTVSYADRTEKLVIKLDDARNDGADPDGDGKSAIGEENDFIAEVENVIGGKGPDVITATGGSWSNPSVANVLNGGPGADFIDTLDGGTLVDRLLCGIGVDTYRADPSDVSEGCETAAP